MTHAIYIPIIIILLYHVIRAYSLYNKKHKELIRYKEIIKVPYDMFSHYEKAYANFYKWMKGHGISSNIIAVYEHMFKYDK